MPHPRTFLLKFLLLTLVIIATIFLIKPSSKLNVKAAGCPIQDPSQAQINVSSGLLSLKGSGSGYSSTQDVNSNCLVGVGQAANIDSDFLSYKILFSTYYTQITSSTVTKTEINSVAGLSGFDLTSGGTKIYYINNRGTLPFTLNIPKTPGSPLAVNGVYVVFVDGNLHITDNITSPSNSGIVLVVQGSINIDPTVTNVDAFIINYGAFSDGSSNNAITFNGSIISINNENSGYPNASLQFQRGSPSPGTAAETILYQPKYFALFKDIFSKDKTIWTEIK